MAEPIKLVPLEPGSLMKSARLELDRQILDMVPAGKDGAAMTIVDATGVRLGIAYAYKGSVAVTLEVQQQWKKAPPTASLKLKVTF